jgi:uncharacterized protein YbjT (DUF2867 family)
MLKTALIAGWTGLVGQACFRAVRESGAYEKFILLQRQTQAAAKRESRGVLMTLPQMDATESRVVDFEHLSPADLAGADDIFCTLGTTIKKAGSQAAFRKVDYDAIVNLARAGLEAGAKRFMLVSSIGADPKSSNFYLRVKGETEQAVAALPFEAVHIMRPSLLLGHRQESRAGEGIAQTVMPLLNSLLCGPLRKYRAIPAETVAKAMVQAAESPAAGVHIYDYDQIGKLAERINE